MNQNVERDVLLAELSQLNRMIADAPPSSYIDCLSLKSRRREVEAELSALQGSGWITDRGPTEAECTNEGDVWVYLEDEDEYVIRNRSQIEIGDPWREIDPPPSYVKSKRYYIVEDYPNVWSVVSKDAKCLASLIPTREAAKEIAAIYERAMS